MLHNNEDILRNQESLKSILDQLYKLKNHTNLAYGERHSRNMRWAKVAGNISYRLSTLLGMTSVCMDYFYGCTPIIDSASNQVTGQQKDGKLYLYPQADNSKDNPIDYKRMNYLMNRNGIYTQTEYENCKFYYNYSFYVRLACFMFFMSSMITTGLSFHLYYKFNNTMFNDNTRKIYDDLYEHADTMIQAFHEKFDDLSEQQKSELVELGLAIKDVKDQITLKYICPISWGMIVWPVVVTVMKDGREHDVYYDLKSIQPHIKDKTEFVDPYMRLPVIRFGFSDAVNEEFKQFLMDLKGYYRNLENSMGLELK